MGQNKNLQAPRMPPQRVPDLECGHAWMLLLASKALPADETEQRVTNGAAWLRLSIGPP